MELDWMRRVRVIKDVAHALSYMHHDCIPSIFHRDISSKNILLDFDFKACVLDFGADRLLKPDSSNWTSLTGTHCYFWSDGTRSDGEKSSNGTLVFITVINRAKHAGEGYQTIFETQPSVSAHKAGVDATSIDVYNVDEHLAQLSPSSSIRDGGEKTSSLANKAKELNTDLCHAIPASKK
ncbi:putative proline-rich receptor-like protein kinase PERK11 [Dioscorea cayenensis subsp. rotundata]|uniref:non-specific serine/threonine protein kinase n=1 Tax=Dioscorea cayennensis subsp. rotundata TaxID=55577 RepID=A0AB40C0H1_DIOCR|nr:putative proline-rich receptor-like protein kinase PERK11 [Dioscorea cayenensis subsp. rotundata]